MSVFKEYTIFVDIIDGIDQDRSIIFKQNDFNTSKLNIMVKFNDATFDLTGSTVKLAIQKADKNKVYQDCTIVSAVNGEVEVVLNSQSLSTVGIAMAELVIDFTDGKTIVTTKFPINVQEAILNDNVLKSTNEFPALNKAIEAGELLSSVDLQKIVDNTANVDNLMSEIGNARGTDANLGTTITGIKTQLTSHTTFVGNFNLDDPNDGDLLSFDLVTNKWKPKPSTVGGGGAFYVLELNKWSVKNDGTNETATTNGLNNAMTWASQNGYSGMLLPFGTYLIDPALTVNPPSYFTLDLNGSTLQLKTSASTKHAVISIANNQQYTRVTNGKIRGDKDTHDFAGNMNQYDGYGIQLGTFTTGNPNNVKFIGLDNLEISNFIGDAITINSAFNQQNPLFGALASSWESGGINLTTGVLEANTAVIRSTLNIDLTQTYISQNGYFGLYGNSFGGLGADITTNYYDVFFYKSDNTFISAAIYNEFFDEVEIPTDANYAKVVLRQPTVPAAANCTITVRSPSFPQFVFIEKCNLHHNRRQGISVCGAKNVYIKESEIHHIGGATSNEGIDPQAGIDIEDGYDLNQSIFVDKCLFHHNNKYNVIAVNGKRIHITNNTLMMTLNSGYVSLTVNSGVDKAVVTGNVIKLGKVLLTGETLFSNNYVYGTQINANPSSSKPVNILNNTFHNCKFVFDCSTPYLVRVDNCRFFNDADKTTNQFSSLAWTLEFKNTPQTISNCIFEGQDYSYLTSSVAGTYQGGWRFEYCRFKNTKTPGIFSGVYVGCIFTDLISGGITPVSQTGGNDTLELRNCKFYTQDSNSTFMTLNSFKNVQIIDCYFEKTSGWMLKVGSVTGEVVIKGNTIKILNDALARALITLDSTFAGTLIVLENNNLSATNSIRTGIDNLTTNSPKLIIRNNTLNKATINTGGKPCIVMDNIIDGERDSSLRGTAAPTVTPNFIGQEFYDTTNKRFYCAFGVTSSTDWIAMN